LEGCVVFLGLLKAHDPQAHVKVFAKRFCPKVAIGVSDEVVSEYRLSDIMGGDVQVRDLSAFISKARPNVEGNLRVQILYQGEVVEENLATGTASFANVSWSPGRP
jgi:hypothetical protein